MPEAAKDRELGRRQGTVLLFVVCRPSADDRVSHSRASFVFLLFSPFSPVLFFFVVVERAGERGRDRGTLAAGAKRGCEKERGHTEKAREQVAEAKRERERGRERERERDECKGRDSLGS